MTNYKSELYDFIIKSKQNYRQQDCINLCKQKNSIDQCGCYNLRYPNINRDVRPCLNLTENACIFDQLRDSFERALIELNIPFLVDTAMASAVSGLSTRCCCCFCC